MGTGLICEGGVSGAISSLQIFQSENVSDPLTATS